MDKNIEITNTEAMATTTTGITTSQYLPIAGGVAGGIVIGALLYRFAISPVINKIKSNKASKIVVEEKKEDTES